MRHFFVLGCPRSGTTMLQQALNRHSEIVIPPETKFFFNYYRRSRRVQQAQLRRIGDDLGIALGGLPTDVREPRAAAQVFKQIAARYLDRLARSNVECFGEKTPEHTSRLATIREVFPEARFVLLYRDGRDVARSLARAPWIRCDALAGMVIWTYYMRFLRRAQREVPESCCLLRYEALVAHPERELRRAAGALGLSYEPEMAEGSGNSEGVPTRELDWKAKALLPSTPPTPSFGGGKPPQHKSRFLRRSAAAPCASGAMSLPVRPVGLPPKPRSA